MRQMRSSLRERKRRLGTVMSCNRLQVTSFSEEHVNGCDQLIR